MADVYKSILMDFLSILIFVGVMIIRCSRYKEREQKGQEKPKEIKGKAFKSKTKKKGGQNRQNEEIGHHPQGGHNRPNKGIRHHIPGSGNVGLKENEGQLSNDAQGGQNRQNEETGHHIQAGHNTPNEGIGHHTPGSGNVGLKENEGQLSNDAQGGQNRQNEETGHHTQGSGNVGLKENEGQLSNDAQEENILVTSFQSPKGNTNLGNTCFFNAALQALYFTKLFEESLWETKTWASAADQNNLRLLNDLLMLLTKQTKSNEDHTHELSQVLNTVGQINHQFLRRTQEDSFELLTTLLGGIFDGIGRLTNVQRVPEGDVLGMDARKIFTGWFMTVYVYDTCKDVEVDFETFTSLSIPIIHTGKKRISKIPHFELQTMTMGLPKNDLEYGLAALEHEEVYNERDLPCRTCKADGSGIVHRRLLIYQPPPVLVLHIDRFKMNQFSRLAKNEKKVQYSKTLDLSKFCSIASHYDVHTLRNTDFLYELYAVVVHTGSLYGGHYYAFVNISRKHDIQRWKGILSKPIGKDEALKREVELVFKEKSSKLKRRSQKFKKFNQTAESPKVNPSWFCVNDKAVTQVEEEEVLNHEDAYILFYEIQ